jgi:pimeloyl-ACP methyl ester carboxylesterase
LASKFAPSSIPSSPANIRRVCSSSSPTAAVEGDIRGRIGAIDTTVCPLYLLTGEYDYSASPRDTEAVVARVKGTKFTVMKGLGHFPMSENPEAFLRYLRPVLEEIRSA